MRDWHLETDMTFLGWRRGEWSGCNPVQPEESRKTLSFGGLLGVQPVMVAKCVFEAGLRLKARKIPGAWFDRFW